MAMNVTFKRGSKQKFQESTTQKDTSTFYYLDSNTLYLGNQLIGGKEALDKIASLESAIGGLSGAMHFKGKLDKLPEDSSLQDYNQGDVILVAQKEYVLVEESGGAKKWKELGDESSYALKDSVYTKEDIDGKGYLTEQDISGMLTKEDATQTYEAKGAAKKVQGETENTVRDCVDAINKLNNTYTEGAKTLSENIENVVAQLTWGEF